MNESNYLLLGRDAVFKYVVLHLEMLLFLLELNLKKNVGIPFFEAC